MNNTLNTGKQPNNKKSEKLLSQTLSDFSNTAISKYIKKMSLDRDSCGNKKKVNKKLLLFFEDCLVYCIFWLDKPSIFFSYLNIF